MPYIKQADRDAIENSGHKANNPGELNYIFTLYALEYVQRKGTKYQHINDVLGALEGAKLEFYRRLVSPYEDTKIAENGDVYDGEIV